MMYSIEERLICQIGRLAQEALKHCEVVLYLQYRLIGKKALFREVFSGEGVVCCTLIVQYIIRM